ncbi:hypothetical protein BC628DRAFT_1412439 [Trametes gibbosa]|nr:hypothetical protein BC628DRAFT_1412439 [Trametes gibbosa]
MRHPYALVPDSRPPSLCSIQRSGSPAPQPNRRSSALYRTASVPALASIHPLGGIHPNPRHSAPSRGHYVNHTSWVTLLLSGQEEGAEMPAYSTGQTIEGVLAVARSSGVLALDVKILGTLKVEEVGGSGTYTVRLIDETVYSWAPARDQASGSAFPQNASFRYTLPVVFGDVSCGRPLPPTYSERLDSIPGFRVEVAYAVVVKLTRVREAATLWRGVVNMRVPFKYTHRTRPARAGPFPSSLQKTEDMPRTLFEFRMRPRRSGGTPIDVHVYLPASQVCSAQGPIPFRIALRGDELALAPFADYRPPASSSFLSLTPSHSDGGSAETSSSSMSLFGLGTRTWVPSLGLKGFAQRRCPVGIQVQRTTVVDTRCALEPGAAREGARDVPGLQDEKSHMHMARWVGQGVVHGASTSANAVVWSGAVIIPPGTAKLGGGFQVDGVRVMDSLVITIESPRGSRPEYFTLSESIPLRLTSDSFGCRAATPVSFSL